MGITPLSADDEHSGGLPKQLFARLFWRRSRRTLLPGGCPIPESGRSLTPIQAAAMVERFATPGEAGQEAVQESNGVESLHLNDAPA